MQVVGVIPVRYHSSRLEGKALVDIAGQPMIQHVWERCRESASLDRVILATDDKRIESATRAFGAEVVMTNPEHPSGTDRIAEVIRGIDCDVVVNIQGDEPMIDPFMIDELVQVFVSEPDTQFATLAQKMSGGSEVKNPNIVKVVRDNAENALYFSRSPIPYIRASENNVAAQPLRHIGIYAYTKACLQRIAKLSPTTLERVERLEQLRALENEIPIRVILTQSRHMVFGVDTPDDLETARRIIGNKA